MKSEGKVTGYRCCGCMFNRQGQPAALHSNGKPICGACNAKFQRQRKRTEAQRLASGRQVAGRYREGLVPSAGKE